MSHFSVSLADLDIDITAIYPSTKSFCQEYLTLGPADYSISIHQKDIDYEQSFTTEL